MNLTLRALLCVSVLGASFSSAKADGPTDYPRYDDGDPSQFANVDNSQVYQPPPEGVCFDDENQSYDCSKDEDYQSYSSIDDGYDPNAHEDFRDALAPYGQWVQSPQYGNVWVPSQEIVGSDFTPYYSGGRWSYTDYARSDPFSAYVSNAGAGLGRNSDMDWVFGAPVRNLEFYTLSDATEGDMAVITITLASGETHVESLVGDGAPTSGDLTDLSAYTDVQSISITDMTDPYTVTFDDIRFEIQEP